MTKVALKSWSPWMAHPCLELNKYAKDHLRPLLTSRSFRTASEPSKLHKTWTLWTPRNHRGLSRRPWHSVRMWPLLEAHLVPTGDEDEAARRSRQTSKLATLGQDQWSRLGAQQTADVGVRVIRSLPAAAHSHLVLLVLLLLADRRKTAAVLALQFFVSGSRGLGVV